MTLLQFKEKGAYLPIMAIGIVALLAVVGLGLDSANLYYAKLQLQKAADVAAISAMRYRVINGPETCHNSVVNRAKEVAYANIKFNVRSLKSVGELSDRETGNASSNCTVAGVRTSSDEDLYSNNFIQVNYDSVNENVVVDAGSDIKLFLMSALPLSKDPNKQIKPIWNLKADATASIKPAHVTLMLDFSNSMACPIAQTDCPCLREPAESPQSCQNVALNSGNKLRALVDGVNLFLKKFEPNRDRISIIPFNSVSQTFSSLTNNQTHSPTNKNSHYFWDLLRPDNGFSKIFKSNAIEDQSLMLGEWTNPGDALLRALLDNQKYLSLTNSFGKKETFYIIFTDGAPTAGTLFLNQAKLALDRSELPNLPKYTNSGPTTQASNYVYTLASNTYSYSQPFSVTGSAPYGIRQASLWYPIPLIKNVNVNNGGLPLVFGLQYTNVANVTPTTKQNFKQYLFNKFIVNKPSAYTPYCSTYSEIPALTINPLKDCIDDFSFTNPATGASINLGSLSALMSSERCVSKNGNLCGEKEIIQHINQKYIKSYYLSAIAYSDYIRQFKGTIYTIGHGPVDNFKQSPSKVNPYQTINDAFSQKSYFLSRLAYDIHSQYPVSAWDKGSLPDSDRMDPAAFDSKYNGLYFQTNDAKGIKDAFAKIANYIAHLTK